MRRTREWWARLTKEERAELVWMERSDGGGYSDNLPEGYGMCTVCSTPTGGGGMCQDCYARWRELVDKGEGERD